MMSYGKLLSGVRLRKSSVTNRNPSAETLSDKARIVTSGSFRRLQSKAQVFSLEENDGVRTRLTHTLEVAFYGELLASRIADKLIEGEKLSKDHRQAFITTVENACLIHDVGNPPFGHLGEYAIRQWFMENEKEIYSIWKENNIDVTLNRMHVDGFKNFDGNAQAFRIVTRLQWLDDEYGLNLTCGLLSSIIKYLDSCPSQDGAFYKKAGFFSDDFDRIRVVWETVGLKSDDRRLLQRSPLTYIMEAADDIAYCVSDIEDALEKGVTSEAEFIQYINANLPKSYHMDLNPRPRDVFGQKDISSKKISKNGRFIKFRTKFTTYLIDAAIRVYCDNETEIRSGKFNTSLLDCEKPVYDLSEAVKGFARKYIYSSSEAINIELSGQRIVRSILDELLPLVRMKSKDISRLYEGSEDYPSPSKFAVEKRLYLLLPSKHKINYEHSVALHPEREHIYRLHLIIDFISGMTDNHAVKIFGMLNGSGTLKL